MSNSTPSVTATSNSLNPVQGFLPVIAVFLEKLVYYGFRAGLLLYLIDYFNFPQETAFLFYGAFTGLLYSIPIVVAWVVDRLTGPVMGAVVGMIFVFVGLIIMGVSGIDWFVTGISMLMVGYSFSRLSLISWMGALGNHARYYSDGMMAIYYLVVNAGAFIATFLLGDAFSPGTYRGILIAFTILMGLLSMVILVLHLVKLIPQPDPPSQSLLSADSVGFKVLRWIVGIGIGAVLVPGVIFLMDGVGGDRIQIAGLITGALCLVSLTLAIVINPRPERALLILPILIGSVLFWTIFEYSGVFTRDLIMGISEAFGTSMRYLQFLNPVVLIPMLLVIGIRALTQKKSFSTGFLVIFMGSGIVVLLLSLLMVFLGMKLPSGGQVVMMVLFQILSTIAEILFAFPALVLIVRLSGTAPKAVWFSIYFITFSLSNYFAGMVQTSSNISPAVTVAGFVMVGLVLGAGFIVLGLMAKEPLENLTTNKEPLKTTGNVDQHS